MSQVETDVGVFAGRISSLHSYLVASAAQDSSTLLLLGSWLTFNLALGIFIGPSQSVAVAPCIVLSIVAAVHILRTSDMWSSQITSPTR
jgi:hypothetical protein